MFIGKYKDIIETFALSTSQTIQECLALSILGAVYLFIYFTVNFYLTLFLFDVPKRVGKYCYTYIYRIVGFERSCRASKRSFRKQKVLTEYN